MLYCKINPVAAIVDGVEKDSKLFKDLITLLGPDNRDLVKKLHNFATTDVEFKNNYTTEEMYDDNGEIKSSDFINVMNRLGGFEDLFNKQSVDIIKNIETSIGVRRDNEPVDFVSYESAMLLATNYNTNGLLSKQHIATIVTHNKNGKIVYQIKIQKKNPSLVKLWKKQVAQATTIGKLTKLLVDSNISIKVIDEAFLIENTNMSSYSTSAGDIAIVGMIGIQNSENDDADSSRLAFLKDFGAFAFSAMKEVPLYGRAIALAESESVQREAWGEEYDNFIKTVTEENRAYQTASKIIGEILANDSSYIRDPSYSLWKRIKNFIVKTFKQVPTNKLSELQKEINIQFKNIIEDFIENTTRDKIDLTTGQQLFSENINKVHTERNLFIRKVINMTNKQIFLLQKLKVNISAELYSIRNTALSLSDLTFLNISKIQELVNIINNTKVDINDAEKYLIEIGSKITPEYLNSVYKTQGEDAYFKELNKKLVALRRVEILHKGFSLILQEYADITTSSGGTTKLSSDLRKSIKKEIDNEIALSKNMNLEKGTFLSEESITRLEKLFAPYMTDDKGITSTFELRNFITIYDNKDLKTFTNTLVEKVADHIYEGAGWRSFISFFRESEDGKSSILDEMTNKLKTTETLIRNETNSMMNAFADHFMGEDNGNEISKHNNFHNTWLGNRLTSVFSTLTSGSLSLDTLTQLMANVSKMQKSRTSREVKDFKRDLTSMINSLPDENNQRDLRWAMEINSDTKSPNFGLPTGRFLFQADYIAYKKARTAAKTKIAQKYNISVNKLSSNIAASNEFAEWHKDNTERYYEKSTDPFFTLRNNLMSALKLTEGDIVFSLPSYERAEAELERWQKFLNGEIFDETLKLKLQAIKKTKLLAKFIIVNAFFNFHYMIC